MTMRWKERASLLQGPRKEMCVEHGTDTGVKVATKLVLSWHEGVTCVSGRGPVGQSAWSSESLGLRQCRRPLVALACSWR